HHREVRPGDHHRDEPDAAADIADGAAAGATVDPAGRPAAAGAAADAAADPAEPAGAAKGCQRSGHPVKNAATDAGGAVRPGRDRQDPGEADDRTGAVPVPE